MKEHSDNKNYLKEIILNTIPYESPEEDEKQIIEEEIREEDYIDFEELLKKYKKY